MTVQRCPDCGRRWENDPDAAFLHVTAECPKNPRIRRKAA